MLRSRFRRPRRIPPARNKAKRDVGADNSTISRINDLTRAGRGNWLGLLLYLAFAMTTVLSVEDADFFIPARQTQLPLIGVSIPTFSFFAFAPVLGAALHVYLHLILRKCTEALATAPPTSGGKPLEDAVLPWLLNDLVLRARRDGAIRSRPMDWLAGVTAMLLIWFAAPFVLLYMWVVSLPAHEEALSALIALCTFFAVYASLSSWVKMRGDLRRPHLHHPLVSIVVFSVAAVFFAAHLILTVLSTEGGLDRLTDVDKRPGWAEGPVMAPTFAWLAARNPPRWLRSDRVLVTAQLAHVQFSAFAPEDSDPVASRHRFRADWCRLQGLEPAVCGRLPSADVNPLPSQQRRREDWCSAQDIGVGEPCDEFFSSLDKDFHAKWLAFRKVSREALPKPDLAGRDFRGADLTGASLTGVNLSHAILEGAVLLGAQLEGADLTAARLDGADLRHALLASAVLEDAHLARALLKFAHMQDAKFSRAVLSGADLGGVQAERASFSTAQMVGANLGDAQLFRASLGTADLRGANLRSAEMSEAVLGAAWLQDANMEYSRFDLADVRAAHLSGANLKDAKAAGADFSGADLQRASLLYFSAPAADLAGADLRGAALRWADLSRADMAMAQLDTADLRFIEAREVKWDGTVFGTALLHSADLRGGLNLKASQLEGATGNVATLLPLALDDGPPFFVCSCWTAGTSGLEALASALELSDFMTLEEGGYICAAGVKPTRTGTPWSSSREPPWEAAGQSSRDWGLQQPFRGDCP